MKPPDWNTQVFSDGVFPEGTWPAPHGDFGHQGDDELSRLGVEDRHPRDPAKTLRDVLGLRASYRPTMPDLRLLHERQDPDALQRLPHREVAGLSAPGDCFPDAVIADDSH